VTSSLNEARNRFKINNRDWYDQEKANLKSAVDETLRGVVEAFKSTKGSISVGGDGTWLSTKYLDVKSSLGLDSWYEALELVAHGSGLSSSPSDKEYTINQFVVRFYDLDNGSGLWNDPLAQLYLDAKVIVAWMV